MALGEVVRDPSLLADAREIMSEVVGIAACEGVDLDPDVISNAVTKAGGFPFRPRRRFSETSSRAVKTRVICSAARFFDLGSGTGCPLRPRGESMRRFGGMPELGSPYYRGWGCRTSASTRLATGLGLSEIARRAGQAQHVADAGP